MQSSRLNNQGQLRLTVERAIDIPNSIFGSAAKVDPYLKVRVDNSNHAERGMVKERAGNNPVFNDSFMINLQGQERGINIEIWDENLLKNTELASVYVPVDDLRRKSGQSERFRLSNRSGDAAGELVLRAQFEDQNQQQFGASSNWSSQPMQQQQSGTSNLSSSSSDTGIQQQQPFSSSTQQPYSGQQQQQGGILGSSRGEHTPNEPLSAIMPNRDRNVNTNTGLGSSTSSSGTYQQQQQPRNI